MILMRAEDGNLDCLGNIMISRHPDISPQVTEVFNLKQPAILLVQMVLNPEDSIKVRKHIWFDISLPDDFSWGLFHCVRISTKANSVLKKSYFLPIIALLRTVYVGWGNGHDVCRQYVRHGQGIMREGIA